jgi:hypothetical protein
VLPSQQRPVLALGGIVGEEIGDDICDFLLAERVEVEVGLDAAAGVS